jgi:hypothetical protein
MPPESQEQESSLRATKAKFPNHPKTVTCRFPPEFKEQLTHLATLLDAGYRLHCHILEGDRSLLSVTYTKTSVTEGEIEAVDKAIALPVQACQCEQVPHSQHADSQPFLPNSDTNLIEIAKSTTVTPSQLIESSNLETINSQDEDQFSPTLPPSSQPLLEAFAHDLFKRWRIYVSEVECSTEIWGKFVSIRAIYNENFANIPEAVFAQYLEQIDQIRLPWSCRIRFTATLSSDSTSYRIKGQSCTHLTFQYRSTKIETITSTEYSHATTRQPIAVFKWLIRAVKKLKHWLYLVI